MLTEIAEAVLIPGWSVRRRVPQLAIGLLAAGVLIPLVVAAYVVLSGRNWVALTLDAQFLAWVMTAGIAAILARVIASDRVSAELGLRNGMVRFRDTRQSREIGHNVTLLPAGAVLFMASGQMGRLGLEGGVGAMWNRINYQLGGDNVGIQRFTAFQSHIGIAGEFEAKKLTVTISVRSYGVVTRLDSGRREGKLFDASTKSEQLAPVPRLQAYLAASLGLGYHF